MIVEVLTLGAIALGKLAHNQWLKRKSVPIPLVTQSKIYADKIVKQLMANGCKRLLFLSNKDTNFTSLFTEFREHVSVIPFQLEHIIVGPNLEGLESIDLGTTHLITTNNVLRSIVQIFEVNSLCCGRLPPMVIGSSILSDERPHASYEVVPGLFRHVKSANMFEDTVELPVWTCPTFDLRTWSAILKNCEPIDLPPTVLIQDHPCRPDFGDPLGTQRETMILWSDAKHTDIKIPDHWYIPGNFKTLDEFNGVLISDARYEIHDFKSYEEAKKVYQQWLKDFELDVMYLLVDSPYVDCFPAWKDEKRFYTKIFSTIEEAKEFASKTDWNKVVPVDTSGVNRAETVRLARYIQDQL
jgi:hypothetical protein